MNQTKYLWIGVNLPQWDAARCFELYQKVSSRTASEREKDDYLRLLMVFISANLGRGKWIASLRKKRLDPEEVAADLLLFLYRRSEDNRFALKVPIAPVLLQALNTAVFRFLVSQVRKGNGLPSTTAASQVGPEDEDPMGVLDVAGPETPSVRRLSLYLREAEDRVLRDVPGDVFALLALYRLMCRAVVRQNLMLPLAQVPTRLRRRLSVEQHAIVSYRLGREIRTYAADPDLGPDPD